MDAEGNSEMAGIQPMVAAEFVALADLLESLPTAVWDSPSLCDGWRVREVVAHVTMAARYSPDQFTAELASFQFDFTALSNRVASRDAGLPIEALIADLRSEVLHQWTPPGGGWVGALNHIVVHGFDVTIPLEVGRTTPDTTMCVALDHLAGGGIHAHFGVDIAGRRLEATDLDWSHGSGEPLRGPSACLVAALSDRHLPVGRLDGRPLAHAEDLRAR